MGNNKRGGLYHFAISNDNHWVMATYQTMP